MEILSSPTERYDRGDKFAFYRGLRSVREVLFVAQDRPRVERYTRRKSTWELVESAGLDGAVILETVPGPIPMAAIYDRVVFPQEAAS